MGVAAKRQVSSCSNCDGFEWHVIEHNILNELGMLSAICNKRQFLTSNTLLIRIQYCFQFKSYGLVLSNVVIVSYGIAKCIREIVSK